MLSKKMVFSLMPLITIFVLAFVVPPVMASDFSTTITVNGSDISHADGEQREIAGSVVLKVTFGEVVALTAGQAQVAGEAFTAADVMVQTFTKAGALTSSTPQIGTIALGTPADGKNFNVPLTIDTATRRLIVQIPKGAVGAADPTIDDADDANAKGELTVSFLPANPVAGPDILKIALVGEPFETITTATFQIHVLLSEAPKDGFSRELLEVKDATVSSIVKLASPGSSATVNGVPVSASWRDNQLYLYLVTLETQSGEKTVTIKVKNFAGMEKPSPGSAQQMYLREADPNLVEGKDKLTLKTNGEGLRTVEIIIFVPVDPTLADVNAVTTSEAQETDATPVDATVPPEATAVATVPDTSVMIPMEGRIYISEIMFARGVHGTLPQWIEISNGSRTEEVNLSGWTITVQNATADADVSVGAKAVFTIPEGIRIDPSGQNDSPSTVLVATDTGRTNLDGGMADGQVVNLWVDRQVDLIRLDIFKRRYSLLSDMAFKVTLAPPATDVFSEEATVMKRKAATDVVGNLGANGAAAWALPISEGDARSSIIRRHISAEPQNGEMADSWVLASDTSLAQPVDTSVSSYYGLRTDISTPGFRAGGALPVELSYFRPARDTQTGAVVITWSTQSELNNAGFFIKRSQQKDGEFKVINATMVLGAGTTSEKQFYTYTDTTAQPDVVYYYQIEDVSFDGNRQTLTRGIRLKGHVGAAGKLTSTWGDLKMSNE